MGIYFNHPNQGFMQAYATRLEARNFDKKLSKRENREILP